MNLNIKKSGRMSKILAYSLLVAPFCVVNAGDSKAKKETKNYEAVSNSAVCGGGIFAGYDFGPVDLILNVEFVKVCMSSGSKSDKKDSNSSSSSQEDVKLPASSFRDNVEGIWSIRLAPQVIAKIKNFYVAPGAIFSWTNFKVKEGSDIFEAIKWAADNNDNKFSVFNMGLSIEAGYKFNKSLAVFGRLEYIFSGDAKQKNSKNNKNNNNDNSAKENKKENKANIDAKLGGLKFVIGVKGQYEFKNKIIVGGQVFGGYSRTKFKVNEKFIDHIKKKVLEALYEKMLLASHEKALYEKELSSTVHSNEALEAYRKKALEASRQVALCEQGLRNLGVGEEALEELRNEASSNASVEDVLRR